MRHVREERRLRAARLLRLAFLYFQVALALHHQIVDVEHNEQRDRNERHLNDVVLGQRVVDEVHLMLEIILRILAVDVVGIDAVLEHLFNVIIADREQNFPGDVVSCLPNPHRRREEDQKHQRHPNDGRFSEPTMLVVAEDISEEDEAEDAPDDQDHV